MLEMLILALAGYVPTCHYTTGGQGGGGVSDMSICQKNKKMVNLGLKRHILMLEIICLYVFMFSGMLHSMTWIIKNQPCIIDNPWYMGNL